jgi:hypothetical protein
MKSQRKSGLVCRSIMTPENYTARRKKRIFEKTMNKMGSDPEILAECRFINKKFLKTEKDGLKR